VPALDRIDPGNSPGPTTNAMRISTGIGGLDEILSGGLIPSRTYLVHGASGTGKTTIGAHFLAAGLAGGERVLFIGFNQPQETIRNDARVLGMPLDEAIFLDLTAPPDLFPDARTYDIFTPAEVEREPVVTSIANALQQANAKRVFVDGFDSFRALAKEEFHQRRLVQSFARYVTGQGATLLAASEDDMWQFVADGVFALRSRRGGRAILVTKYRGSGFHAGPHPLRLTGSGVQVLPNVA
jgi:circadian clock protein KaiC